MTRACALAVAVVIASTLVSAQAPESPRFDVASIKRNLSGDNAIGGAGSVDTYRRTNTAPMTVLWQAYRSRFLPWEIIGAPPWLVTERFDIVAKTDGSPWTSQMILSLLADRFKLRTHEETREQDVYQLVIDRRDGRVGPKLVVSTVDATEDAKLPAAQRRCFQRISPSGFVGRCVSMGYLIESTLDYTVRRRIVDATGLTGTFDIDLSWEPTFDAPEQRVTSDAPSIFTALREQLGLRLEPGKVRLPVLVIDAVEHPSED